jgi:2-keto-4-pentenoate hydratase/2-oxohepta-3-ene-1,7-dioic acid hydratase in catechol pathway
MNALKLVNFQNNGAIQLGIQTETGIIDVAKEAGVHALQAPLSMEAAMSGGQAALAQLAAVAKAATQVMREDTVHYAPCVANPGKIVCVGLNYKSHRDECKMEEPEYPVLFSKFNNALAAHKEEITLPTTAEKFDYEAELVIVIGKETAKVSRDAAMTHVFGYTAGNDLSARDLQLRTGQWLLGKSCDSFAPIGPCLVTADELDPNHLDIQCTVNGEVRQSANTGDMIFDCATIVSYVSQYMTLQPGDIIFSGTPSGVILGYPAEKQVWLQAGDEVAVTIEKIGTLKNTLR